MPKASYCSGCLWRKPQNRDGGWCYMFRDQPDWARCKQWKDDTHPLVAAKKLMTAEDFAGEE